MTDTMQTHLVLHVARRPYTGVWSLMRNLAREQASRPDCDVALGVLHTPAWHRRYGGELETLREEGIPGYGVPTPDLPFSIAYPLLMAQWKLAENPVRKWFVHAARRGGHVRGVVHFHNAWLSGAYPPIRAPNLHVGMIATYHGIQGAPQLRVQPVRRAIHRYLARRFIRCGGELASVDKANVEVARELFGIAPERFTVIPNGVPPVTEDAEPRRQPDGGFVVGHVGILNDGKGWRITAEAVELLRERDVDVRFVIAGAGPDTDRVRHWAAEHADFARFLGEVPDAASSVMPGLDLLVMPSLGEGMPMAALEALAASVPIAATKVGGLPEVIVQDRNGCFVDRDAAAVAAAIQAMASDPDYHAALRSGARDSFQERFHIRTTADRYAELYDRVLK